MSWVEIAVALFVSHACSSTWRTSWRGMYAAL